MPDSTNTSTAPDRSLVRRSTIPATHPSRFEVDEKARIQDSTGNFRFMMYITHKRNDASRGWEYQLKDTEGRVYKNNVWVVEKELDEA